MLRTFGATRTLGTSDLDRVLRLCAQDPMANVFVAARVQEGGVGFGSSLLGIEDGGRLKSVCWVSANVVPVACDEAALDAFAGRLRRQRRRVSSVFGDATQVLGLWERLERHWGEPRSLRSDQPMMAARTRPADEGRPLDPRVRRARPDEIDLVLPASAAMFTEEIGYPPYVGSDRDYRSLVAALIRAGHTYVVVEDGRVIFKADIGSLAGGVAQIQGVWVAPDVRGQGIAAPAMCSVVQHIMEHVAPVVTLYVNAYNEPALRAYAGSGFTQVGRFATVIL
ncbi:GNAT family N-acetyltransferase [Luteipulveratus flavus]|uniref:GNAT family N-acetyltransferase n=1 Tax=Luteipulveratus flavus TaxID=3031728 RepID=A0ABT6C2T8_9MICO|nr:GNAT family N-acetyltransferase [Luteipulveratus sp. YIM 133296]MDF8263264.1 GNAT family N-acetyltransferase [Luteipulveratus sp. YIM 133296]